MGLKQEGIVREDAEWYFLILTAVICELVVYVIGVSIAVRIRFGIQYAIVKYVGAFLRVPLLEGPDPLLLDTIISLWP